MALPTNLYQQLIDLAPALSLEECKQYFSWVAEDDNEAKEFERQYNKAKFELRMEAIRALRHDLQNGKTKTTSALGILLRFSDDWVELNGEPGGGKQFVAKISIGQ